MSISILVVLVLGIGAGYILPENISGFIDSASSYMLLVLLFSVGIDMGLWCCGRFSLWRCYHIFSGESACKGQFGHFRWSGLVQPFWYYDHRDG